MQAYRLHQLINVGKKYKVPMPVCTKIHDLLVAAVESNNGVPSIAPRDLLSGIDVPLKSTSQLIYSLAMCGAGVLGIFCLFFVINALFPRESKL